MTEPKPTNWTLVCFGLGLMFLVAWLFIFVPLGLKQIVGLAIMLIMGLGLTVAGSGDQREK